MARKYIVQSWNDAASYSGEQIGNRLASSKEVHFLPNGQANLDLYEDDDSLKKDLKLLGGVEDKLDKLDDLELSLHKQFRNGKLSAEDLERHLIALIRKRDSYFKPTAEEKKIKQLTAQFEKNEKENRETLDTILKMEENLRQQEQSNETSFVGLIVQHPWLILIVVFILGKIFS